MAREHDFELVYVHFPLHPDTPAEGRALTDLFAGRESLLQDMMQRLDALFRQEGLPWAGDRRSMTYNSRLAQELAAWAVTQPDGERIHDALFRAYFVDGVNLADIDRLVELTERLDLPPAEARDVLEQRRFQEAVDRDWQRSRELGLGGVPAYVFGGRAVVGAQPYEVLELLVEAADG